MALQTQTSSANSFLALLNEQDQQLKIIGLQKLSTIVDYFWAEIAEHLSTIESLYEDEAFPKRQLAAFLTSKVYYHLEEYDDALKYALESGELFDISQKDQYIECLVSKCIDQYIKLQQSNYEKLHEEDKVPIDVKLKNIVEKMLEICIKTNDIKQALGIALESRRLDIIISILKEIRQPEELADVLNYLFELSKFSVQSFKLRKEVIDLLIAGYKSKKLLPHEYSILCQCYFLIEEPQEIANLIFDMVKTENEENILLAYQIAQDLSENENKGFVSQIIQHFPTINPNDNDQQLKNVEANIKPNLFKILNGKLTEELNLQFLSLNNHFDPLVIANIKTNADSKNSIIHEAIILSNSIFQAGTTNQSFLVDNYEWVSKASHWANFTSVASLGVIHRCNHAKGMEIMTPYLPGSTPTPKYYAHGGSLYALGLIHYNTKNQEILNYLLDAIKNPGNNQNEAIIHGACLGIGLVGFASNDEVLYEEMKNVLFTDSATTGEAAGLAIGLLMAGSRNGNVINDILEYAHETKHEKIIRSIALSLAIIMFNAEEKADGLIEEMCNDKDGIMRYGAMFLIGMAYVGKAENKMIKKLLHHASADFSDDVRRAAVINLSFVLLNSPDQLPKILNLLSLSYNPHVRYGVAIALGIACANTVNNDAISLLEFMLNDGVNFVRQGAFVALAFVLQQCTEVQDPRVEKFRKTIKETYSKKQEDVLSRLGAILANSILDAGGRNSVLSLFSGSGFLKLGSCVGLMIFLQFWYWFPLTHFLSLALTPTALIGVNKDLKVPKGFKFISNAKPSLFEYPALLKPDQKEVKKEAQKVDLSTTAKAKARAAKKAHDKDGMEIEPGLSKGPSLVSETSKVVEKKEDEKKDGAMEEEKKKDEPNFVELENPARILLKQQKLVSFGNNRYHPIIKERKKGIVFLVDKEKGNSETFFEAGTKAAPQQPAQNNASNAQKPPTNVADVPIPEEFIFDEDEQNKGNK